MPIRLRHDGPWLARSAGRRIWPPAEDFRRCRLSTKASPRRGGCCADRRKAHRRLGPKIVAGAGQTATVDVCRRVAFSQSASFAAKDGGRFYATRFRSAADVAEYVAENFRSARRADAAVARHLVRFDAALLVPRPHIRQHVDPGDFDLPSVRRRPVLRLGRRRLLRGHLHARLALRPGRGPAVSRAGTRSCAGGSISALALRPEDRRDQLPRREPRAWPSTARRAASCGPIASTRCRPTTHSSSDFGRRVKLAMQCLVAMDDGRRHPRRRRSTTRSTSLVRQDRLAQLALRGRRPGVRGDGPGDGRRGLRRADAADRRARRQEHRPANCSTASTIIQIADKTARQERRLVQRLRDRPGLRPELGLSGRAGANLNEKNVEAALGSLGATTSRRTSARSAREQTRPLVRHARRGRAAHVYVAAGRRRPRPQRLSTTISTSA